MSSSSGKVFDAGGVEGEDMCAREEFEGVGVGGVFGLDE